MADPLSIAASIAGLITLADIVFDRLMKYVRTAKNATKETEELAKEVNLLGGALNSLSRLARSLDNEPFGNNFRMYHIEGCNDILSEIDRKLKKLGSNSLKKVVWPFSSARVKEMLDGLAQHKQSINLALSANSMDLLLRCLAREEDLQKTASEIKADIEKTRQVASRIHRDGERERVLNFFLKYNPQQNYEMSLKLRHPRTGTWLLRLPRFQTWLSTADEKLWLSGIPGAGKTVLAGTIIEAALAQCNDKIAGAFFFCDYKHGKTQSPQNIMGALAYQIAIQKEDAYALLQEYYDDLHPPRGLPRSPTVEELVGMVGKMVKLFDRVFLIVDGIDECGDHVPDVLDSLCDVSVDSENISIALLSRDEHYIRDRLEDGFICEGVAAHTEDVEEYVASEIEERIRTKRLYVDDPELKDEIMKGLIDGAKGITLEIVSVFTHKDLTPLHMACLLSLPKMCKHLLKIGTDVEQKGPLGTPVQCAVGMMHSFQKDWNYFGYGDGNIHEYVPHEYVSIEHAKETVEYLLGAGAQLRQTPMSQRHDESLMKRAMSVLKSTSDISLITFLLSKGCPVEEDDATVFSNILTKTSKRNALVQHFKPLIETLNSMIGHSHLHRELCLIAWKFAVTCGFDFVSDTNLIDPSISLTPESQKELIIAAVRHGSVDKFTMAAQHSSIRLPDIMDNGKRLLHIALENVLTPHHLWKKASTIKTLVEAGCSFLQSDDGGCLPVNSWSSQLGKQLTANEDGWKVQIFIDNGVTVNSQDSKGQNLLHTSVVNHHLLSAFLEYDSEANIIAALCMVDNEGYTPLSKALNEQHESSSSILFERGGGNPETWKSPLSPLLLAARANSEDVFRGLVSAGVALPGTDYETFTPLHYIGPGTSVGFVTYLKALYPGACEARVNGKTPIDLYIEALFHPKNPHPTNIEILTMLYPYGPHSHEGGLVWEHFSNKTLPTAYHYCRYSTTEVCTEVIKGLLRLGCLTSYEIAFQKSALLLLLERFDIVDLDFDDTDSLDSGSTDSNTSVTSSNLEGFWPLTGETFCDILNGTRQWPGFQTDSMAIHLLKTAVYSNKGKLVRLLLEKGVSAHRRVQDQSALEVGCESCVKIDTFRLLLEFADKECLNETNTAKHGAGLIHLLAKANADASCKVAELIQRGADPNLRVGGGETPPALVYYLDHCPVSAALALLEHGADPTLTDRNNIDGCLMAAWAGFAEFLSKVLEMKTPSWRLDWQRHLAQVTSRFLERYMNDGGSLLTEPHNPVGTAVANGNRKGLRILFRHLRQNAQHYA
ncbi:hypothetical protein Hte_008822 [Hypoxylon texense]